MSRFDPNIGIRYDEVSSLVEDVRAQLNAQPEETAQLAATTVEAPVIDNTFTPIFSPAKKNRFFVTLRWANFGTATDIKNIIVKRSDIFTSDDYDNKRFTAKITDGIDDNGRAAQLFAGPMDEAFDPGSVYDIIRLVAVGASNSDLAKNPPDAPLYSGYPGNVLFSFTTPANVNPPSAPSASRVIKNILNPLTPEYDAILVTRVHAPLDDAGAAQTWGATNTEVVKCLFDHYSGPSFISAATNASPIVITATAHGIVTGDIGLVTLVGGNTAANGTWTVTKVNDNQLSLNGSVGNGAYTSGGKIAKFLEKIDALWRLTDEDSTRVDPASTPANQGYVDVPKTGLGVGWHLQWYRNTIHTANGDKAETFASPAIDIYTALIEAASGIPELTSPSFTVTPIDNDPKHIHLVFNVTQPTPTAVALKKYQGFKAKASDYSDVEGIGKHQLRVDEYNVPGVIVIDLGQVKIKPGVDNYFRITITAASGATRTFDWPTVASAKYTAGAPIDLPADTLVPSSLVTPILHHVTNAKRVGIKAARMEAGANNNHELYKEVAYQIVNDAQTIAIGFLDPDTGALSASEVRTRIGTNGSDYVPISKSRTIAQFGGPADRNIRAYYYVTNAIGTSLISPLSNLVSFASLGADGIEEDTAVVSAPAAPIVVGHSRKIKIKCIRPTGNFNQFVLNEVVARVKNSGGTILGYIIDGQPPTNNATEFWNDNRTELIANLFWAKADIQSLYPTGVTIEFYNRITNGFGVSASGTATSFNIAAWTADPLSVDTAAVPTPSAPTVIGHSRKIKIKVPKPASQWNVPTKVEIVARVKNGGGTILGYVVDGQPPTNSASVFYNDEVTDLKTDYFWSRDYINSLYTAPATIEFFARLTNGFGVSADGTATVFTISTWTADVIDAVVPGGTLTAPTVRKLKREGGFKLDLTAPSVGIVNLRRANVYIGNGAHGVATLWLSAADLTASTGTESSGAIAVPATGGVTIPVSRATLESIFGAGANVTLYATWTNDIGTSGFSGGTTYNLANGESGSVGLDLEIPGGTGATLTAPTVYFEPGKGLVIDFNLTGLTFMATHTFNSVRVATLSETVPTRTITNAPNTVSPTVVTTSAAHGFSVNQTVVISGVLGNTAVNGTWVVLNVPTTTTFTIGVAGSGAYTSGGSVSLVGAFLDIPTKTLVASAATSKKEIGKGAHTQVSITRRKLRDLFGPTAHIAVRYFVNNTIGETASAITDVDLATLLESTSESGLEQEATIPARAYAFGLFQILPGAGFLSSKAAYDGSTANNTVGKDWWDTPAQGGGGGVRIDTTGTRGLKWLKATHNIEVATNVFTLSGQLCCQVPNRQIVAGETYSLQLLMKMASGTYTLNAFTVSLYDEVNGVDIPNTAYMFKSIVDNIGLTTAYSAGVVAAVFLVDSSYVQGGGRQWLRLKFGENPPQIIYVDNVSLVRRAQSLPWDFAREDVGVPIDVTITGDTGAGGVGSSGGGGNGNGSCFGVGTMISTPYGYIPIEDVHVGDTVLGVTEDGRIVTVTVTAVHAAQSRGLLIQTENWRFLRTTPEHPLCVADGRYLAAELVGIGDSLMTMTGDVRVVDKTMSEREHPVYNLSVEAPHTFIADGFVVHNKIAPGGGGVIPY